MDDKKGRQVSVWERITAISTSVLAICTIFAVVFGYIQISHLKKDLGYRSRPYVDFIPNFRSRFTSYRIDGDKLVLVWPFELINGSEVPVKEVKVKDYWAGIWLRDFFKGKDLSSEKNLLDVIGEIRKENKNNVEVSISKTPLFLTPKSPSFPYGVSFSLSKQQKKRLYDQDQPVDNYSSLYIYYKVAYESVLRQTKYETSYVWEFTPLTEKETRLFWSNFLSGRQPLDKSWNMRLVWNSLSEGK